MANVLQWVLDMWAAVNGPPPPPPFIPTYENQHFVVSPKSDGTVAVSPLNPQYFATESTATEMMKRFSADHVVQIPYTGAGGPIKSDAKERWLVWRDGTAINAGLLSVPFVNSPEDRFPNVAANAVRAAIDSARSGGQRLPESAA